MLRARDYVIIVKLNCEELTGIHVPMELYIPDSLDLEELGILCVRFCMGGTVYLFLSLCQFMNWQTKGWMDRQKNYSHELYNISW